MKKNNKFIYISVVLLLIVSYCIKIHFNTKEEITAPVIDTNLPLETEKEVLSNLYQEEINKLKTEYNNNDIVGILNVENTNINEIIVQSTNNDYYLWHTIYGEYNWRGQTFLDYRMNINDSKKLLIYGHNSCNYTLAFKELENYYDSSYYNDHKYIYLQTDKKLLTYSIFSVYVEANDWSYYNKVFFTSDEEYKEHLLNLKNKSFYETNVEVDENDEILIIQTCSCHPSYQNYENKFLLIVAKRV